MPKPRLLLLSRQGAATLPSSQRLRLQTVADVDARALADAPNATDAARLLASVDLLGATNACLPVITAELLDAAPHLRGIVLYATGYDHLDVAMLAARGVGLSIVTDYATVAVAEHTIALTLALATRLHLSNDRCRGIAPPHVSLRGVELAGQTMGVVGLGRIGHRVSTIATALEMRVVGSEPEMSAADRARRAGVLVLELDELLTEANVVSLCASHRFGAAPLVGKRELRHMSPEALLVNASRSSLVDTAEVITALRQGRLRGYAVDDRLPTADGHTELAAQGRLLQTGHSAWWRDQTMSRGALLWGERLIAAAIGSPQDVVTWPGHSALVAA